jgi:hypothetical protein
MGAFQYSMPAGIPGAVNRVGASPTVVAETIDAALPPTQYGTAVMMDAATGTIRVPTTGDTAFYGMLVRPYPTNASQDGLGVNTPPASGICNIMKSGFMTVLLRGATAAVKNGAVNVWLAAAAGGQIPGGITAVSSGSTAALPGAYFVGPADANGMTEIGFNI